MKDWTDLHYLLHGKRRRQRAYSLLQALDLWTMLADFKPVLAGMIPLDINIAGSATPKEAGLENGAYVCRAAAITG